MIDLNFPFIYSVRFVRLKQNNKVELRWKMTFKKVIEKFGIYFDEMGFSKTYGRLFGFFITASKPVSMGDLLKEIKMSKSTASVELRKLLLMGVIEKVSISYQRADFYQLKPNIWRHNLEQKIESIKKLRSLVEEIPKNKRSALKQVNELFVYCTFIEVELKSLRKKYEKLVKKRKEDDSLF